MITDQRKKELEKLAEKQYNLETNKVLREKILKEKKLRRLKEIREVYNDNKEKIYVDFVNKQHLTEWQQSGHDVYGRKFSGKHCYNVPQINSNSPLFESIKILTEEKSGAKRIREHKTVDDMMVEHRDIKSVKEESLRECIKMAAETSSSDDFGFIT